jgi:predicted nucleic acid-binding protein
VFVDTSALIAVLDRDEDRHSKAVGAWQNLVETSEHLLTTNYVLLETAALVQRRVGFDAVRALQDNIAPILTIEWISRELHSRGIDAALATGKRNLSVVDCISFIVMRQQQTETAFAFDAHFSEQGFTVVP